MITLILTIICWCRPKVRVGLLVMAAVHFVGGFLVAFNVLNWDYDLRWTAVFDFLLVIINIGVFIAREAKD